MQGWVKYAAERMQPAAASRRPTTLSADGEAQQQEAEDDEPQDFLYNRLSHSDDENAEGEFGVVVVVVPGAEGWRREIGGAPCADADAQ